MKKQNNFLQGAAIAFTFSALLLFAAGCQQADKHEQKTPATQTKTLPPKIDIHTAVAEDNPEAVQQHIAAGTNIDEKDPFGGSSPLISACLFGKTGIAKLLVDAGANLNFTNNDGSTPLITAAFFCRPEIVKMLLEKKADKTIKNKYGQTAYEAVAAPFAEVKESYDALGKMLAPMGLKLDYAYLEKTRPEIAALLK
jgi:uncharacterized protein